MPRGGKRSTSFRPGQSGNPNGRPKAVPEIRFLAQDYSEAAIATLVGIMNDRKAPPAARVAASNAILDRGHGKPPQTIDATNTNVNYAVSDQPMSEQEWIEKHVTEH
jgi:Family of unknown function (DUF5681)